MDSLIGFFDGILQFLRFYVFDDNLNDPSFIGTLTQSYRYANLADFFGMFLTLFIGFALIIFAFKAFIGFIKYLIQ